MSVFEDRGTFEGGMSFGDDQVSDDIARVYVKRFDDGTFGIVTVAFAVVEPIEGRFSVDERVEYMHCSDESDPGSSELDCDYEYGDGSYLYYDRAEDALTEARRLAALDSADTITWNYG